MSGGETEKIAKLAELVSSEIFNFFRWEKVGPNSLNFGCVKKETHAPQKTKTEHTHPADVVFKYSDPYLNKSIYLHTDLKSYAVGSIKMPDIKKALKSLGKSIDCARVSSEWLGRYHLNKREKFEIRGMLFVYNHDDEYDKNFYDHFKDYNGESLHIKDSQQIHIIEPSLINYLSTILVDINALKAAGTFPRQNYTFYYPDLILHKASGSYWERAATAELIASPYFIIHHKAVKTLCESTDTSTESYGEGYLIYYRRDGSSEIEFRYLFDALSRFQILNSNKDYNIRIRVANRYHNPSIISNFSAAINSYVSEWGEDEHRLRKLKAIKLEIVNHVIPNYKPEAIGWRD
ncbi:hypothetical protein [Pseudomonas tohonis]|uniref:hypothetical protein n=1 Tax=Pseudomonas tohonis TaxID=2725477 RepID=UPI0022F06BD5|nr:hypothetical protein [Pseudomonas tohonis]